MDGPWVKTDPVSRMLLLLGIPFQRCHAFFPLPPSELHRRLDPYVHLMRGGWRCPPWHEGAKPYTGTIRDDGLVMVSGYQHNAYTPVLRARFVEAANGTRVTFTVAIHPVMAAVMLSILLGFLFLVVWHYMVVPSPSVGRAIVVMLLLIFIMFHYGMHFGPFMFYKRRLLRFVCDRWSQPNAME